MSWYAVKKKTETRWTAYELDDKPRLKRGYEMLGPYESISAAMIASNETNAKRQRQYSHPDEPVTAKPRKGRQIKKEEGNDKVLG